jgi:putative transposase
MIQRQLKLRLKPRQEQQLDAWLWHLTGIWNWALRKIELDAKDGIYYTPKAFRNLLADHSKTLGIPSHTLQGILDTAHTAWQRCVFTSKTSLTGRSSAVASSSERLAGISVS